MRLAPLGFAALVIVGGATVVGGVVGIGFSLRHEATPVATGLPAHSASSPSVTATATSIAVPTPAATEMLELQEPAPGPLPPGLVVYYYAGRLPIEGQAQEVRRAYRLTSDSPLVVEDLRRNLPIAGELTLGGLAIDPIRQRIAISICVIPRTCGGYGGGGEPGAEDRLFLSDDGGISWKNAGTLPIRSVLVGFSDARLLVATSIPDQEDLRATRVWVFESGETLIPPPGGVHAQVFEPGGEVLWETDAREFLDSKGTLAWAKPDLPGRPFWAGTTVVGSHSIMVAESFSYESYGNLYFGAVASTTGQSILSWYTTAFSPAATTFLTKERLLANAFLPGPPGDSGRATLIDLSEGGVTVLTELRGENDQDAFAVSGIVGEFTRVRGTGSCLNVREDASLSATVLGWSPVAGR